MSRKSFSHAPPDGHLQPPLREYLNSHVDPVFRKSITRETSNNILFEKFLQNVDGNGTSIQDFSRKAALYSKLYGVTFVVMDNVAQQPANLQGAIETRSYPYVYIVNPATVEDIQTDKYGRLTAFSFREDLPDDGNKTKLIKEKHTYNIRTLTAYGWTLTDGDGKIIEQGKYNLGRVPVTIWRSRQTDKIMQASEFLSIAKTNLYIYQLCSWLSEILQNQAFSILTYPRDISSENQNLIIGTDNALAYPMDSSNAPSFISPPADPANMITNQIDRLIQEIYRMANLSLVTGVQKQSSGVSKQWDFERTNQTLADFAQQCESAELDIADDFSKWTNTAVNYNVSYADDFSILDVADELDNAQKIIDMQIQSSTLTQEIAKKVIAAYCPDVDDVLYNKIMTELQTVQEDKDYTSYTDMGE